MLECAIYHYRIMAVKDDLVSASTEPVRADTTGCELEPPTLDELATLRQELICAQDNETLNATVLNYVQAIETAIVANKVPNDSVNELEAQNAALQVSVTDVEVENGFLLESNATLSSENTSLQATISDLTGQNAALSSENATLQSSVADLTGQNATLSSENTALQATVAGLETTTEEPVSQIVSLQETIGDLERDIAKCKRRRR